MASSHVRRSGVLLHACNVYTAHYTTSRQLGIALADAHSTRFSLAAATCASVSDLSVENSPSSPSFSALAKAVM